MDTAQPLTIYPVLDLKGGVVVRGVGGERALYRPVVSTLTSSAAPLDVARAFRDHLGLTRLYVADLDAIQGGALAAATLESLCADGFELLVDAGVRDVTGALAVARSGAGGVIAALETLPDPAALGAVVAALGAERVVFSLDLKGGALLGDRRGWPQPDAREVAHEAVLCGVRRLLVLDLAAVGRGGGPAHLDLLRRLRDELPAAVLPAVEPPAVELPAIELLGGGGVRSRADIEALHRAGASGILIASALHDGSLGRRDLELPSTP